MLQARFVLAEVPVSDPESASKDRLLGPSWVVGEADPRPVVVHVQRKDPARNVDAREVHGVPLEVPVRELVVDLERELHELVADTRVEGHFGRELDVVLDIERELAVAGVIAVPAQAPLREMNPVRDAQQEVGHLIAGVLAVEAVIAVLRRPS